LGALAKRKSELLPDINLDDQKLAEKIEDVSAELAKLLTAVTDFLEKKKK
jgi:predicted ATP-grasp superfamily ATP-dependent carboligase